MTKDGKEIVPASGAIIFAPKNLTEEEINTLKNTGELIYSFDDKERYDCYLLNDEQYKEYNDMCFNVQDKDAKEKASEYVKNVGKKCDADGNLL